METALKDCSRSDCVACYTYLSSSWAATASIRTHKVRVPFLEIFCTLRLRSVHDGRGQLTTTEVPLLLRNAGPPQHLRARVRSKGDHSTGHAGLGLCWRPNVHGRLALLCVAAHKMRVPFLAIFLQRRIKSWCTVKP